MEDRRAGKENASVKVMNELAFKRRRAESVYSSAVAKWRYANETTLSRLGDVMQMKALTVLRLSAALLTLDRGGEDAVG